MVRALAVRMWCSICDREYKRPTMAGKIGLGCPSYDGRAAILKTLPNPSSADATAAMSLPLQEDQGVAGLPTSCAGSVFDFPSLACSRARRAQPAQ